MGVFDFLTENIGLDIGSQNCKIVKNGSLIYNEPSIISVNVNDGVVSGFGESIIHLKEHSLIKPINYAITDFQATEEMLKGAIKKGLNQKGIWHPSLRVFLSVPSNASQVELRAYRDSAEHFGAKEVHMLNSCFAASIGINILFEKKDFILIDFSASKIEITVFSNSIPIVNKTLRLGTWLINNLIKNYISREYLIKLSNDEVDKLLNSLNNDKNDIQIRGISISMITIDELLNHYFVLANDIVQETIEEAKQHINFNDVKKNGVYFSGGGFLNDYFKSKIILGSEYKTQMSNTPLLDCANGIINVMANPSKYKDYIFK